MEHSLLFYSLEGFVHAGGSAPFFDTVDYWNRISRGEGSVLERRFASMIFSGRFYWLRVSDCSLSVTKKSKHDSQT